MKACDVALPVVSGWTTLQSIMLGGLVAGAFDGLDAVLFFGLMRGVPATRIFQYIASGLMGPSAFLRGWQTVLLGIGLHFVIATGAATAYCLAARKLPSLVRRPFLYGPLFGLAVFFFMYRIVIPLSAVTRSSTPMPWSELVNEILVHAFLVGLPIALIARSSDRSFEGSEYC